VRDGTRRVFVHRVGATRTRSAPLPTVDAPVIDSGFDVFIRRHWQALAAGDSLKMDFLVPSHLKFMHFRIVRHRDADAAAKGIMVFRLKLDRWFAFVLPHIDVGYFEKDHTLAWFRGLSNLRDMHGENLKVVLRYPPAQRGVRVTAAALDAARRASLDVDDLRRQAEERARAAAPVVFDEAEMWMADAIASAAGDVVVVTNVVHLEAVAELAAGTHPLPEGLDEVPPKSLVARVVPWAFSAAIVVAFVLGFLFADPAKMQQAALAWVISNASLAAVGAALALAHPITIVATALSAPIVSLNPAVGAGMVGALAQAFVAAPTVADMDRVGDDIAHWTGWWKNRLSRIFLVFVLANLFSSIGSFVALAWFPTQ